MAGWVTQTAAQRQPQRLSHARAALKQAEARLGVGHHRPAVALTDPLTPLLPTGLTRGEVVAVHGCTSLVLALAGAASQQGGWTAMVGMPAVGMLAAARRGLVLSRLVVVPQPGVQAATVIASCVETMEVVICGPVALSESERRRVVARAREYGAVIIAAGNWPGAHTVMTVTAQSWMGPGAGEGRLRSRTMTVDVSGRRQASRNHRVVLDGLSADSTAMRTTVAEEVA